MRAKMRVGCKFSPIEGQDSPAEVSDNEFLADAIPDSHVNRKLSILLWRDGQTALSTKNVVQNGSWELVGRG
jgi:hypothetical protein